MDNLAFGVFFDILDCAPAIMDEEAPQPLLLEAAFGAGDTTAEVATPASRELQSYTPKTQHPPEHSKRHQPMSSCTVPQSRRLTMKAQAMKKMLQASRRQLQSAQ